MKSLQNSLKMASNLFILSSVPLAVYASFYTEDLIQFEPSEPPGVSLLAIRSTHTIEQTRELLEANGMSSKKANFVANYAQCASNLSIESYAWQRGERLTGLFMIPDSSQGVCGYSKIDPWHFRNLMKNPTLNAKCLTRINRLGLKVQSLQGCQDPVFISLASEQQDQGQL